MRFQGWTFGIGRVLATVRGEFTNTFKSREPNCWVLFQGLYPWGIMWDEKLPADDIPRFQPLADWNAPARQQSLGLEEFPILTWKIGIHVSNLGMASHTAEKSRSQIHCTPLLIIGGRGIFCQLPSSSRSADDRFSILIGICLTRVDRQNILSPGRSVVFWLAATSWSINGPRRTGELLPRCDC